MKTQFQEPEKGSLRDVFIVSGEPAAQAVDELESITWRDAGQICFGFAAFGVVLFGLHYLVKGLPPRDTLITGFVTVTAMFGLRVKRWKIRARYLASLASAMAIVGLFLRFVVQDKTTFSPLHLVLIVALLLLMWLGSDARERYKRKRG